MSSVDRHWVDVVFPSRDGSCDLIEALYQRLERRFNWGSKYPGKREHMGEIMGQTPKLAAIFLAHAKVRFRPLDPDALEELLVESFEAARAQWPDVAVVAELFVRHVAERLPEGAPGRSVEQMLDGMFLADLYLACGCAHSEPSALSSFERHYLERLRRHLRRPPDVIDDIIQMTAQRILVRTKEREAWITEYAGEGKLWSWVLVIALRIKPNSPPRRDEEPVDDVEALYDEMPARGEDPEWGVIREQNRTAFRAALSEAFSELPDDARLRLQLYYFDGLTTTEIAKIEGVHQSTVSNRLTQTKIALRKGIERRLRERLGLSPRSVQALIDSQLEVSISEIFGVRNETC